MVNATIYPQCEVLLDSPHTLIAGTTGSGKSVLMNATIYTELARETALFYFVDLKRVELKRYKNMANCVRFADEPEQVIPLLQEVIDGMERRYATMEGVQSDEMPIYVVVDELADTLTIDGVLDALVKIGRLGRASNIHLICATQDPSRRTLCAQLMQNFTCTVALRCKSAIESRQITGFKGAEALPRYGKAYIWDADGYRMMDVPMVEEDDLQALIKEYIEPTVPEMILEGTITPKKVAKKAFPILNVIAYKVCVVALGTLMFFGMIMKEAIRDLIFEW